MNTSAIGTRYAKALFMLGEEKKKNDKIYQDLLAINELLRKSIEFQQFMESPIVKVSKKIEVVSTLLASKIEKETLQFLNLIIEKRRELYLRDICIAFSDIYKKQLNIKTVVLTSSQTLTKELVDTIKNKIEKDIKSSIELIQQTDASLIGGFTLQINDLEYDASVSSKLHRIKQNLLNN